MLIYTDVRGGHDARTVIIIFIFLQDLDNSYGRLAGKEFCRFHLWHVSRPARYDRPLRPEGETLLARSVHPFIKSANGLSPRIEKKNPPMEKAQKRYRVSPKEKKKNEKKEPTQVPDKNILIVNHICIENSSPNVFRTFPSFNVVFFYSLLKTKFEIIFLNLSFISSLQFLCTCQTTLISIVDSLASHNNKHL